MGVIRITKHEAPYVMLDKTALKDKRLSFRAKGLHAYLMSKPDDWHINSEHLASLSPKEGREAIMMAMRELRNNGYTRRVTQRDEKGHLLGSDIIVYETPWLAEQDASDHKLMLAVGDLVEATGEPSEPKDGLADSRVNLFSEQPKVGLPESRENPLSGKSPLDPEIEPLSPKDGLADSRLDRETGYPTVGKPVSERIRNVTTQRKEITNTPQPTSLSAPTKKGRQKVTTPPPEILAPSENLIAWHQREFPQYDLSDAIESCLDHYRKQGKEAADYEAAIRNWCRNGHKYGTLKPATTKRQTKFVE